MSEIALRANSPGARSRRPKTYALGRVCATKDCDTLISRYNRAAHCFRHRPVKYPRLRGVFTDEYRTD